jgi:glycosyltransferase involved in cell wall biosynthesis
MSTLSLCICTMNRPDELRACLLSVRSGTEQPAELIVSDDGTDPQTVTVAAEFGATYLEGPHRGLGPNRNACIRAAGSSHLAFIDDDVIVSEQFVAQCHRLSGDDVVTGYEMNFLTGAARKVTASNANFLGYQELEIGRRDAHRAIVINATVFPRKVFEHASFDESIKYGSEEIDMARQVVALGYRISYDDRLWVEHHPSALNRAGYEEVQLASLLYVTLRAYWRYERSIVKSLGYLLYAPLQHYLVAIKNRTSTATITRSLRLAVGYCRADIRREGWRRTWSGRDHATGGSAAAAVASRS